MGGHRWKRHWDFPSARFLSSSEFFRVGGGQRGEPLSASHATAHHLPSLTGPRSARRKRVFAFIRGASQSFKLHKSLRFNPLTGFYTDSCCVQWSSRPRSNTLLTSVIFAGLHVDVYLRPLAFFPFGDEIQFYADQICSHWAMQRECLQAGVCACTLGEQFFFASVLDTGWIVYMQPEGAQLHFSNNHGNIIFL